MAIALPSVDKQITPILYIRISSIVFIYAGALSFNALYIQSIGSGIGIYSGLFQVTTVSQLLDTFIFIVGALILIAWPSLTNLEVRENNKTSNIITQNESLKKTVRNRINNAVIYSLIVLLSTLGASLLISFADFIFYFLSIELQSFYGLYSQSIVSGTGDSSEFLQVSASLFGITNPTGTLASEEPTIETPSSNNQIYDKNKTNIDQTELENVLGSAIDEGNTQELLYTWSHRG